MKSTSIVWRSLWVWTAWSMTDMRSTHQTITTWNSAMTLFNLTWALSVTTRKLSFLLGFVCAQAGLLSLNSYTYLWITVICYIPKLSISRTFCATAFHVSPDFASYLAHLYLICVCEELNKTKELFQRFFDFVLENVLTYNWKLNSETTALTFWEFVWLLAEPEA